MTIISSSVENNTGDGFGFSSDNQYLLIEEGVTVLSTTGIGVHSNASFNTIANYGNIAANNFAGIVAEDGPITIYNKAGGSVFGHDGISLATSGSTVLNNGEVTGDRYGLYLVGDFTQIVNTGTISGYGAGLEIYGGRVTVQNTGTIAGAIGIAMSSTEDYSSSFTNGGLIDGGAYALVDSGRGNVRYRNNGVMNGDVSLGSGTNTFDGRGGSVNGIITGGGGADKILAGNDGETIDGGYGHDRLYAGTGADTVVISSFKASDTDIIKRFDVSQDLIQLDHSVFNRLQADTAPTFAIGTKASSPTDHLFYNAGTGGLFYDVDGSGAARAPYLLATLDKGLKLTASNFDVV